MRSYPRGVTYVNFFIGVFRVVDDDILILVSVFNKAYSKQSRQVYTWKELLPEQQRVLRMKMMWRAGGKIIAWEARKLLTVFRIPLVRCEG